MILLDTHIWIWWVNGSHEQLTPPHLELLAQAPEIAVSAISCLEMAWLVKRGRIELEMALSEWWRLALEGSGVQLLPLTPTIAERAASLPEHHKDPADRIIIATALERQAALLSFDGNFPRYTELGQLLLTRAWKP